MAFGARSETLEKSTRSHRTDKRNTFRPTDGDGCNCRPSARHTGPPKTPPSPTPLHPFSRYRSQPTAASWDAPIPRARTVPMESSMADRGEYSPGTSAGSRSAIRVRHMTQEVGWAAKATEEARRKVDRTRRAATEWRIERSEVAVRLGGPRRARRPPHLRGQSEDRADRLLAHAIQESEPIRAQSTSDWPKAAFSAAALNSAAAVGPASPGRSPKPALTTMGRIIEGPRGASAEMPCPTAAEG
jgi:hypothetical protein